MENLEEKTIRVEYDAMAEDALDIAFRLSDEFGVKYEHDGEGTITYWVESK